MAADQRDGKGESTARDGSRYKGDWVAGQMQGMGEMTYADGSVYVGPLKAGLP